MRSVWGHSPGGDTGEEGGPKGSCLSRTPRPPSSLADPHWVSGPSSLGLQISTVCVGVTSVPLNPVNGTCFANGVFADVIG